MAVGDIKKFGALYVDGVEFGPMGYCSSSNAGTVVEYRDAKKDSSKRKFIEISLDGKKAYIDSNFTFKHATNRCMYNNNEKVCTIENEKYTMRLLSESEWKSIPLNIITQIEWEYEENEYSHTLTSSFENGEGVWLFYQKRNNLWVRILWGNTEAGGATSSNAAIYALVPVNNPPSISGSDLDLGNKTSSFSITYSISDEDSDQELTVKEKLNGSIIRTLKNPVKGNELTLTISEERFANLSVNSTNTIEIEVTDGQATTYRRYTFVKTNSAPFITYTGQADLGELTTKPSITYSVKDNEGDAITVTEKLNGEVINQFSATTNTNYTVGITDTFWLTCGSNTNTVEIIASDALGGSSSKTITFYRKITKLQIVMKNAIETDAKATKILVSPQWTTTGGVGKVEVCNNGFDSNPTWEDATTMVVLNRPYLFTNSSKTDSKWGIKIRITVTKNQGYDGEVAIFGFGGAYE